MGADTAGSLRVSFIAFKARGHGQVNTGAVGIAPIEAIRLLSDSMLV